MCCRQETHPVSEMTSIQKVLLDYDEYLRLKEIESRYSEANSELANLRQKIAKEGTLFLSIVMGNLLKIKNYLLFANNIINSTKFQNPFRLNREDSDVLLQEKQSTLLQAWYPNVFLEDPLRQTGNLTTTFNPQQLTSHLIHINHLISMRVK